MTVTRALAGRTVVVTRAAAQAQSFVGLLEAAGARVLALPTIAIAPPESWEPLDRALDDLAAFRWVIFTSVNGVAMVGRRLEERGLAWTRFRDTRVAAIGPATAAALTERGLTPEIVPDEYRAEGLAERLRAVIRGGDRVLLPRAAKTRDLLVTELRGLGAEVTEVAVYTTQAAARDAEALRAAFEAGEVDVVTFTSSSTARNFARLFTDEERGRLLGRVTVASIGPITAATAAEYGLETRVMPADYTIPALARAIEAYFANADPSPASGARRS